MNLVPGTCARFWALCLLCNHTVLAAGTVGAFFAVEYFLAAKIDENHVLKLFKFCNLWYQAVENDYFTRYRNLDIFGYAVERNAVILASLFAVGLAGAVLGTILFCKRYPCRSGTSLARRALEGAAAKAGRLKGAFLERLSLAGAEAYKLLFPQKGLAAVLVLMLLLVYRADFTQVRRSTQQELYYDFINTHLGVPDAASDAEIADWENKMDEVDKTYEEKLAGDSLGSKEVLSLDLWYLTFEEQRSFLEQVESQTESLYAIREETGIEVWYVNQHSYDHLLRDSDTVLNFGLFFAILWIAVGMYAGERGSGMLAVIRSCPGERALYKTKRRVAVAVTSAVYLLVLLFEIISVAAVYVLKGAVAPVQSILALSDVSLHLTIWQYFLLRYAGRYLLTLLFCFLACKIVEAAACRTGRFRVPALAGRRKNGVKD